MLKHLSLKDFVIVRALEVEFGPGFSVLTGETGAGKSILIDALQLALGARAESLVVREGAVRAEITAAFDTPASLAAWLEDAGFEREGMGEALLLRRVIDAQGKSRSFINGSAATASQLREVAEHLVEIHGQHAWQSLTRPSAMRELLDTQAGIATAPMASAFAAWKAAQEALARAQSREGELALERERLEWQLAEVDRLAPGEDEWPALTLEHQRLAHGQALIEAAQGAASQLDDADPSASRLLSLAVSGLEKVRQFDPQIEPIIELLEGARTSLDEASRALADYFNRAELDPARLASLDDRISAWMGLARRFRVAAEALPRLQAEWRAALRALEAASDVQALQRAASEAESTWRALAEKVSLGRQAASGPLAERISAAMQKLGMAGGRFEIALVPQGSPQAYGLESVEFLVAGHAGSQPRALAKVASGGELSRLALAIAVTTAQQRERQADAEGASIGVAPSARPATLIFDEIDSGVGGTVADAVGQLMQQLGSTVQVLAVTHLPQVAACGDGHFVVAKRSEGSETWSEIKPVSGPARETEVARMLGGDALSGTSAAHARQLLSHGASRRQGA
jgi:DNA repair protein RecN (Recombination protein N)